MAIKSKARLAQDVNQNIYTNSKGLITANMVKGVLLDMIDSLQKEGRGFILVNRGATTNPDTSIRSSVQFNVGGTIWFIDENGTSHTVLKSMPTLQEVTNEGAVTDKDMIIGALTANDITKIIGGDRNVSGVITMVIEGNLTYENPLIFTRQNGLDGFQLENNDYAMIDCLTIIKNTSIPTHLFAANFSTILYKNPSGQIEDSPFVYSTETQSTGQFLSEQVSLKLVELDDKQTTFMLYMNVSNGITIPVRGTLQLRYALVQA